MNTPYIGNPNFAYTEHVMRSEGGKAFKPLTREQYWKLCKKIAESNK